MKTVYITGCLGFIGCHITKQALDLGWTVYGVDKVTYAANSGRLDFFRSYSNFKWLPMDINALQNLTPCDAVINTAAETHVDNSIAESKEFLNSNIYGVHHLLSLYRYETKKPLFLQFSTDEVYGDIIQGSHQETDILKPSNPYSATKAAADMLIFAWGRTYGVPFTIVRPTNNYGCWQYPEKLLPCICRAVIQNKTFPLHNNGEPRRTWLHVEDTADAIIQIVKDDIRGKIFNISGNYEDSNINVARKVVKLLTGSEDVTPYCDFGLKRVGQDIRYSVDSSQLKSIGWKNRRQFDDALPAIVEHYREKFKC